MTTHDRLRTARTRAARRRDVDALARAAARLDDDELDRAWVAALRGDVSTVERTLARTTHPTPTEVVRPGHTRSPWRDSSWLFGRRAFGAPRDDGSGGDV